MLNELEKSLVMKFRSLLEQRLHIHQLIVFGSRARGDADEDSDLDILVVIEEPETYETLTFIYDCGYEAGMDEGVLISPTVFSRTRWENSPERSSAFVLSVRGEGIPV